MQLLTWPVLLWLLPLLQQQCQAPLDHPHPWHPLLLLLCWHLLLLLTCQGRLPSPLLLPGQQKLHSGQDTGTCSQPQPPPAAVQQNGSTTKVCQNWQVSRAVHQENTGA